MFLWILLTALVLAFPNITAGDSVAEMMKACNITKSCLGIGLDCFKSNTCTAAATVVQNKNLYEFEMRALAGIYVAVGLSNDSSMGDTAVVACVLDSKAEPNVLKLQLSWNTKHLNNPINSTLAASGVTLLDSSVQDGSIYCKFSRKPVTTVGDVLIDLHKSEYHLLVASGVNLKADGTIAHHAVRLGSTHAQFLHDVGMFDGHVTESTASQLLVFSLLLPCQLIYLLYHSSG